MPDVAKVLAGIGRRFEASATYREIQAGLTNRSYLIEVEGRPHVLRVDTRHVTRMGLDRRLEFEIQHRAAAAGIAPPILAAEPDEGWLLYEYLEGRALQAADLSEPATIEAIAKLLRRVHDLPASGTVLSLSGAAERYAAIIRPDSGLAAFAHRCLGLIAASPPPVSVRCCHNDIVASNIITNHRLRLIDWEYACDNDPLFDLASLAGYHDLDERMVSGLLAAYAGTACSELKERLSVQRRLFDALQWLWLAAQQVIAPGAAQLARLETIKARIG